MANCTAFEVTVEDVYTVLRQHNHDRHDPATLARCLDVLDGPRIEKAALYATDFDQQVAYAHEEIARQLQEAGLLAVPDAP